MRYVKRVESTLKKGCAIDLGPKTLIVGPNKSGKSTIIQSIQLAACGYVTDAEEREVVNQHTAIARLFPPEGPWSAQIELGETDPQLFSSADKMTYSWELERSGGKGGGFKKPKASDMALAFPVQQVLEKLRGGPDTIRTWLESLVCPALSPEKLAELLPPAAREAGAAFAKRHRTTDMLALAKAAQSEATELKKQADYKESTVDTMMAGVPTAMLDDKREEIRDETTRLVAEVAHVSGQLTGTISEKQYAEKLARLDTLRADYERINIEYAKLPPEAATPDPQLRETQQKLMVLRDICRTHAQTFGLESCMVCGQGRSEHLSKQITYALDSLEMVDSRLASTTRLLELVRQADAVAKQHTQLVAELSTLRVAEPLAGSVAEKQQRLVELHGLLAKDDAARVAWRNREAMLLEIEQLRARSDELLRLVKAFKRAGTKYLEDAKGEFEDRVTSFLPDKVRCQVDLDTGRIGFVEDEVLVTTLSGAQGMQLLFAVASFVASLGSTPSVLTNPDRGWSSDTLVATMSALTESPCQVILTSTVFPDHPVDGWTVVRLTPKG